MSPDLDKKLCDKYPKIFANRYKSPQETCMCWGFEVGDGWYNLIDLLCEALTYTYTTSIEVDEEDGKRLNIRPYISRATGKAEYFYKVHAPQVIADQVKEKFGTFRFYYHLEYDKENDSLVATKKYPELDVINKRYADYIDGIVHFADVASAHVCEVSGKKGELHIRGGWFKVLSREIAKEDRCDGYVPYAEVKNDLP
jgi:hypothetical protein